MMPKPPDVVADRRRPPFCYQTHAALDAIRGAFSGSKLSTALGIYLTLTESANRSGGASARTGFEASRSDLAAAAGVSPDTLDRYVKTFVLVGVLEVEKKTAGAVNLPNLWVLADVPDPGAGTPPGRTGAATPGRTGAALRAREDKPKEEKRRMGAIAPCADWDSAPPPLTMVDGRNVAWDTLERLCQITPGDPNRRGELSAALSGSRAVPVGIRALAWGELVATAFEGSDEEAREIVADDPAAFERMLVAIIERRAALYRDAMHGATLTPTALAKWWLSLEALALDRRDGGLTAEQAGEYAARVEDEVRRGG